jgi:hypothetical protein
MPDLLSPLYILSSVYIYLPINSNIMEPQNLHPFVSPYAKKKSYHLMRFKSAMYGKYLLSGASYRLCV